MDPCTGHFQVRASPKVFDVAAIERALPAALTGPAAAKMPRITAMKFWCTLLGIAYMDKEGVDYLMTKVGTIYRDKGPKPQ